MKKKNGFTLIELLAVIIILGILMIIAIPSVTKYISDSRKSAYVDTAKEIIGGARNIVNEGKLGMYATDTTYYIPTSCIKTENASKSPYGDFTKAYVGVIYDGRGYKYYWISVDDAGQGVSKITPLDQLDTDDIESDLKDSDIESVVETTGIGNRSEIHILNCNTKTWDRQIHLTDTSNNVSEEGGGSGSGSGESGNTITLPICKRATQLHTAVCNRSDSDGCSSVIGSGNTVYYGNLGTQGATLSSGDALDCDVNNDGIYDSTAERFYYVTSSGSGDNEKAILIYYGNINNDGTNITIASNGKPYDSNNNNWHGPVTGIEVLPSNTQWNNNQIIKPEVRSIKNENGGSTTTGGTIDSFDYTGKAARLLTYQEIVQACGTGITTNYGYLNNCLFLMENIGLFINNSGGTFGHWLETPVSSTSYTAWLVNCSTNLTKYNTNSMYAVIGIRPVIEVLKSNIAS